MKFEESMKRLEDIASKLENGTDSLDDSLLLYKEGVELIKKLNAVIDEAEKSITEEENV
ncbi:MAG: exodeoxyribonuclease VII small subunit [Christensenellaceae bacterium]|nr:exodeoxyribonuclease VII small subunit [Christensenellaceae bacterium]